MSLANDSGLILVARIGKGTDVFLEELNLTTKSENKEHSGWRELMEL